MKLTMTPAGLVTTILVITLGIVDLCFVLFGGTGSSVSNFLVQAGWHSPILTFTFGFTAGHIFGNMWPDTSRLKAAWEAWDGTQGTDSWSELCSAIDEIVNADHGPLRYFKRKK